MKNLLVRSILLLLVLSVGIASEVFPQGGIVPPSSGALSSSNLAINRNALYTGNHPVTVPLFQVTGTRLSQGVSVTYNSLSTIESELGQGWTLNAGGLITRVVFGLPDDLATYGWNTTAATSDSLYNSYSSGDFQRLKNLSLPCYDWKFRSK